MPKTYEPLEETYFTWLYDLVDGEWHESSKSHIELMRQMHSIPFTWFIPNDDNRGEDGRDLRFEFQNDYDISEDAWLNMDCSMLEMTIGLARRMAFDQSSDDRSAFWHLLRNLGIADITDSDYTPEMESYINRVITRVNERSYSYTGQGGFFPLRNSKENQQYVELLYQMSAYILENDSLYL